MFCSKCGAEVPDNFNFCVKCGAPLANITPPQNYTEAGPAQSPAPATEVKKEKKHIYIKEKPSLTEEEGQDLKTEKPEKAKKIKKTILIVVIAIVVLAIIIAGLYFLNLMRTYKNAEDLVTEGKYDEAIEIFTSLGDFRDSPEQITETTYLKAEALFAAGDYTNAKEIYTKLADYKDSADKLQKCNEQMTEAEYQRAMGLLNKNDYPGAREIFAALGNYKDSAKRVSNIDLELKYRDAVAKYNSGNYQEALNVFNTIKDYKESASYISKCNFQFDKTKYKQGYKDYIAGIKKMTGPINIGDGQYYAYEYSLIDFDNNGIKELVLYSAIPNSDGFRTTFLTYNDGQVKQIYLAKNKGFEIYSSGGKYYALYQEMVGDDYLYSIACGANYMNLNLVSRKTQNDFGESGVLNSIPGATPITTYDISNLGALN